MLKRFTNEQLKMFQFGWGRKETEWCGREIFERIERNDAQVAKSRSIFSKTSTDFTKFLVASHNFNILVFRLRPLVNQLSSSKDVFRARLKIK